MQQNFENMGSIPIEKHEMEFADLCNFETLELGNFDTLELFIFNQTNLILQTLICVYPRESALSFRGCTIEKSKSQKSQQSL